MQIIPVIPATERSTSMIKNHKFEDKKGLTPILTEDEKGAKDCEKSV